MDNNLRQISTALGELLRPALRDPWFYFQVLLFAAVAALVWLVARRLARVQWRGPGAHWHPWTRGFYFPLLGLVAGRLVAASLAGAARPLVVFERLYGLFWVLLLYRLGVAAAARFVPRNAEVVRQRILRPVALLVVALRLAGQLDRFLQVLGEPVFTIAPGTPQELAISPALLIFGPLVIFAIFAISQGLRTLLTEDVLPGVGFSTPRAYAIGTIVGYAAVVVGTLMALAALGVDRTSLTALSGALAVGAGFGLQQTINNLVSGFLIMFDPLVNVGDRVEVENERGTIRYIGIRNSVIETEDGTRVVMPNAALASTPVLNLNLSRRPAKVTLPLLLAPHSDPRALQGALRDLLSHHVGVREVPAPSVTLLRFEPAGMLWEVEFWVEEAPQKGTITHEVNLKIWETLQRLAIPFAPAPGDK